MKQTLSDLSGLDFDSVHVGMSHGEHKDMSQLERPVHSEFTQRMLHSLYDDSQSSDLALQMQSEGLGSRARSRSRSRPSFFSALACIEAECSEGPVFAMLARPGDGGSSAVVGDIKGSERLDASMSVSFGVRASSTAAVCLDSAPLTPTVLDSDESAPSTPMTKLDSSPSSPTRDSLLEMLDQGPLPVESNLSRTLRTL